MDTRPQDSWVIIIILLIIWLFGISGFFNNYFDFNVVRIICTKFSRMTTCFALAGAEQSRETPSQPPHPPPPAPFIINPHDLGSCVDPPPHILELLVDDSDYLPHSRGLLKWKLWVSNFLEYLYYSNCQNWRYTQHFTQNIVLHKYHTSHFYLFIFLFIHRFKMIYVFLSGQSQCQIWDCKKKLSRIEISSNQRYQTIPKDCFIWSNWCTDALDYILSSETEFLN